MKRTFQATGSQRGTSMLELLVVIAFAAILAQTAISNIKSLEDPLADASFQVSHFLRLARSSAISRTLAIEISPASASRLQARSSTSCDGTMTAVSNLSLQLPNSTQLTTTDWAVCFTQRGLADSNVTFSLHDSGGKTRTVEVALGGGTEIR